MQVPQLAMQIEEIIVEGSAFGKKAVKSASMPPPSTVLAQSDMASIWSHGMTAGRMPSAARTSYEIVLQRQVHFLRVSPLQHQSSAAPRGSGETQGAC